MRKLTKKWQLFLYGISGMGVNMLNLIIGSYLCDALMTEGFDMDIENWTYLNKTLIVAGVWSVMILVAKVLDGLIDIPFASFTDNLKTKWGKRRPAILIGFIPMVLSFVAFLNPLSTNENSLLNTFWFGIMLCLFYTFYTLTMVTYYATFSEITENEVDRVHLSNYKTFFDVVYYVIGYALIPVMVGSTNIRIIAYIFLPLSLTMMIPFFLIKEKSTLDKDRVEGDDNQPIEKQVGLWESLVYSVKCKPFIIWLAVYCTLNFGLQLFLAGQNVVYSGPMQFSGLNITFIMACAFAPVPFTLMIYNNIVNKKGLKSGYIFSTVMYIISMGIMCLCNASLITNDTMRLIIACIGGIVSSFGTGCFFSINYTVPSTIAVLEERKTGISHPAMFFAVQGLASGIASAISTGLVWVNLKNIKDGQFVWVMPIIVLIVCALSLILTIFLPSEINTIGINTLSNKDTTDSQ